MRAASMPRQQIGAPRRRRNAGLDPPMTAIHLLRNVAEIARRRRPDVSNPHARAEGLIAPTIADVVSP
jgi:hypothetical protein